MNKWIAAGKDRERCDVDAALQAKKQEQMRASLRWTTMLLGLGAFLAPSVTLAQSTSDPQAKTPPPADAVGPSELQNFSLPGGTAKPADQPPAAQTPESQPSPKASQPQVLVSSPDRQRSVPRHAAEATSRHSSSSITNVAKSPAATAAITPQPEVPAASPAIAPPNRAASLSSPLPQAPSNAAPSRPELSIIPWLIAAFALAGGTLFLLWRRRSRGADDPEFDMFVAPEPVSAPVSIPPRPLQRTPAPAREPAKPAPARPRGGGIVSSRLRPSLEITVQPLRCLVEGDRVVVEFELELFNAGTAPARSVQAEAGLLNAGGTNEHELAAFFSRPPVAGDRIDAIGPMKRMAFTSQVVAPRASLPDYEVGGRKAIVPVLAFNALYQWSGGKAQTSAAYLVGRETRSEKLGPFVSDGASREYVGLAAHLLPTSLRT